MAYNGNYCIEALYNKSYNNEHFCLPKADMLEYDDVARSNTRCQLHFHRFLFCKKKPLTNISFFVCVCVWHVLIYFAYIL